jgi:hypothetical protein
MIVIRKGIREFVIDSGLTPETFEDYLNEFLSRCNEPRIKSAKVKALFKAVQNIENQFEKL